LSAVTVTGNPSSTVVVGASVVPTGWVVPVSVVVDVPVDTGVQAATRASNPAMTAVLLMRHPPFLGG
jgi:hypothetical protein